MRAVSAAILGSLGEGGGDATIGKAVPCLPFAPHPPRHVCSSLHRLFDDVYVAQTAERVRRMMRRKPTALNNSFTQVTNTVRAKLISNS